MNKIETPKTAQELVEKWLPNKDFLWNGWVEDAEAAGGAFSADYNYFCKIYFPEALAARDAKLIEAAIKAQREINRKDAIDSFNIFLSHTNMYRTEQQTAVNDFCRNYDRSARLAPSPTPEQIKEQMEK